MCWKTSVWQGSVSASSFAANMSVKQNALDHADEAVEESFYVDDGSQQSRGSRPVTESAILSRRICPP